MTKSIRTGLMGMALAAGLLATTGTTRAQNVTKPEAELAELARSATSSTEHARVAKGYRLQADALDARALEFETKVARSSRNAPPMAHKWPAIAQPDVVKAREQAMDARRAARESRQLADHHIRLSVEARADE